MTRADYYQEAFEEALHAEGLSELLNLMTTVQRANIGSALAISVECASMAFYTPPASDRYAEIERDWKAKLARLQTEFDRYRDGSESAMRRALRTHYDTNLSITEEGEVYRHDGRTERIL